MTIKEIAAQLEISPSTVSKALTGAFDVSEETRNKIIAYAKQVGYKTKVEKRILKQRNRFIILFDNMTTASTGNILYPIASAFTNYAAEYNCEVVVESLTNKPLDFDLNKFLKDNNYVGAFIIGLNLESHILAQLDNIEIPVVLYDNNYIGEKVSTVSTDSIGTISRMVSYLVKRGHRKIGFLNGEMKSNVSNERLAGYIIGLNNNGIIYDSNLVVYGDYSKQSGENFAQFFKNTDVTAVICACDLMALGLIEGLGKIGVDVPGDISITGFDDLPLAANCHPPLTTVHQDLNKIGKTSFTLLVDLLSNKTPQRLTLRGDFIERASVIDKVD